VQYVHAILRRALGDAERWGPVYRNVARLATAPRVPRHEATAFNVEQARAFMATVSQDRLAALYLVALAGGLRRGEALALRWEDIEFEAGTVAVRRTLSKVKGGWAFQEPKTAESRRVVRLPGFALESLRSHRTRQREERLRAGREWQDLGIVFTTEFGSPIDGRNLLRVFKRHVAAAGLDPAAFTFHSLRHSSATLMLSQGVTPKVVQETLGHSRIGVTMDVYAHVLPHLQEEAAARRDGLLGGAAAAIRPRVAVKTKRGAT
jgi:integrase